MKSQIQTACSPGAMPCIDGKGHIVAEDKSFRFWHETEEAKSTLRPRVRKYIPKKSSMT